MKKALFAICLVLCAGTLLSACSGIKSASSPSLKLDPQKGEWFRDAKFGMFIHWGLYSILEGSYNGHTMPDTTFKYGNSWAYHGKDYNWKPATRMLRYLVNNISMGGNYLLNIGPKADGSLPAPAVRRLREMGAWLGANGESVYGAKTSSLKVDDADVYLTEKTAGNEKNLYIFITEPKRSLMLSAVRINSCYALETGQPIVFEKTADCTVIHLPESLFKDHSIVVLKASL